MTSLKHALDKHGSLVAVNDTMINKIIDVIQTKPVHQCLRLESCDETCPSKMFSIHMELCFNLLSHTAAKSLSDTHIERLIIALCTRLNDTSDVVYMVIKLIVAISHVKPFKFIRTVIEYALVPTMVSLLSHDTVSIRKDAMELNETLFCNAELPAYSGSGQLMTYIPVLLHLDLSVCTKWVLNLLLSLVDILLNKYDNIVFCVLDFGLAPYFALWLKSNERKIMRMTLAVLFDILLKSDNKEQLRPLLAFDRYCIVSSIVHIIEDHRRFRGRSERRNMAAVCLVEIIRLLLRMEQSEFEKADPWFAVAELMLENECKGSSLVLFIRISSVVRKSCAK